ncbi:MAG: hypothetical protein KC897_07875 [Candidatus Omnitrophica bacterium]|nr:hypothetical protein [Candidatus Omnitrophota bacterium]MCB9719906.1 hypothetical protein [Candidatus Omnitrophota bacterium]
MSKPSVGATILWWLETIVSIRVLLFTVPVMINRQMTAAQPGAGKEDGFILMITVAAALYLFTGLASILGHKLRQVFHYLAAGVVLIMTAGLAVKSGGFQAGYLVPSVIAIVFTALAFVLTKNVQTQ